MSSLGKPLTAMLLLLAWTGCGDDAGPPPACDDDTRIDCVCPDTGARGRIACEDGVLGACLCGGPDGGAGCSEDIQCDDGAFCNGQERCLPDAPGADERGCLQGMFVPFCEDDLECTIDRCSDRLNRCVFDPPDADDDGHFDATCLDADGEPLGDDCDDDDPLSFPGNLEICDEDDRDEDCDPETFGQRDADGDGAIDIACCNGDNCGDDCDDSMLSRRPQQVEFCDEVDNDCDDAVDEEAVEVPWYSDGDGDGFGTGGDALMSCVPIPGRSLLDTDCADESASRHPAQLEICDFVDNNCNELADEGAECGMPQGYPVGEAGGAVGAGGAGAGSGSGSMDGGMAGPDGGVDAGAPPLPDLMRCPGRDVTGATEVGGLLDTDTTWSGLVHITTDVRVAGGAHLTILAGTHVIADSGTTLYVGWNNAAARITAEGTEDDPITLCGKADIAGYWEGLLLDAGVDPASAVSWLLVSDAGSTAAGLRIEAAVPLTDVHVRNSAAAGIEAWTFGLNSARLIASENAGAPLALMQDPAVTRLPEDSLWTGNGDDRVEIRDTSWDRAVVMHDPGVPYLIKNGLQMLGDVTYAIDPGVVIVMEVDTMLEVGWNNKTSTIEANGTSAAPVVIRGQTASPSSWIGLRIGGSVRSSSYLRHVEVRDAGFGAPALDVKAPITLDNVTLDGNTGPALWLTSVGLQPDSTALSILNTDGTAASIHADAMTKLGDSAAVSGNTTDWLEVRENTHISSSGTIRDLGVPYYLPFGTTTRSGSALTIEAGVEFVMGNNTVFEVGWNNSAVSIFAMGTSADPIVFRHESGQQGGWAGVELTPNVNVSSSFDHVELHDGGSTGFGNLYIRMANALPAGNLTNCSFENGSSYGIYLSQDYATDYSGNGNNFAGNLSGDIYTP